MTPRSISSSSTVLRCAGRTRSTSIAVISMRPATATSARSWAGYLLSPQRVGPAMKLTAEVIHLGGHTTVGDMAFGIYDPEMEWAAAVAAFESEATPFRVKFVPHVTFAGTGLRPDAVRKLSERNTHRLQFGDHVKLFTDGAFFSQLMQLGGPGYVDGHHGEWLMPPETFENAGAHPLERGLSHPCPLHRRSRRGTGARRAGKAAMGAARVNHRFTIEHFGISTAAQARRIADLGAIVSANPIISTS